MAHPNLSDEINARIDNPERLNDLDVRTIKVGSKVLIHTRNTIYILHRLTETNWTVEGHPKFCPTPTPCRFAGSTWGGSMIKVGHLGIGMHMELYLLKGRNVGPLTTSPIQRIVRGRSR